MNFPGTRQFQFEIDVADRFDDLERSEAKGAELLLLEVRGKMLSTEPYFVVNCERWVCQSKPIVLALHGVSGDGKAKCYVVVYLLDLQKTFVRGRR